MTTQLTPASAAGTGAGKAASGIAGFDAITSGGLPRGRTTMLSGGPGSGITIFGMQFLVQGAQHCGAPGIFLAFEEAPARIADNLAGFGWDMKQLQAESLFLLDAQPLPDLVQSGTFDPDGMLATVGAKATEMGARRIVFDALDVVLALLPEAASQRREMYRLHQRLLANDPTGLITVAGPHDQGRERELARGRKRIRESRGSDESKG